MANFETAVDFVLRAEGGYVCDPSDPGGATKYGISQRSYPKLNIKSLTEDDAREIYHTDFWNKYGIDKIEDDNLALVYFDTMINMGPKTAAKFLDLCGADPKDFLLKRIAYYVALCRKKSTLKKFLPGWINRVMDLYDVLD